MSTPHNQGEKGQFAKVVIMPGDPLRAKMIAENFLEEPQLINQVRGMLGYTGTYKGKKVSVMGSGMGMPSIGIYSYELFTEYDVDCIIRVGSAGAYTDELDVLDVVLADSAWSESSFAETQNGCTDKVLFPSERVTATLKEVIDASGHDVKIARIHSSDVFYKSGDPDYYKEIVEREGCQAVEMESFALFHNANVTGKEAACLLTISDSFVKPELLTPEERQNSFKEMIEIALDAAILL